MQPYFCPYLGYFALIKHTEYWIVFDTVQFIRHGWIERNRILKPGDSGWQYIRVPLEKHSHEAIIKDVKINSNEEWKIKIFAQLAHYKKKAKYYTDIIKLLEIAFNSNSDSIVELNVKILSTICDYLSISFNYAIFSEMKINLPEIHMADEWALKIAKAIGYSEYYNPIGGSEFFDREKYKQNGINLHFLQINLAEYNQCRSNFEPGLSVIDAMMFNSPLEVNRMLDSVVIL